MLYNTLQMAWFLLFVFCIKLVIHKHDIKFVVIDLIYKDFIRDVITDNA